MTERWSIIEEFPDHIVSESGCIKSMRTGNVKVQRVDSRGYLRVCFWKNGKTYCRLVHRLVAIAFIGQPPIGMVCNHLNFDRSDPRASNLEWVTPKDNLEWSRKAGRMKNPPRMVGENHFRSKLTDEQALLAYQLGGLNEWSYAEIGLAFGVVETTIVSICHGKSRREVTNASPEDRRSSRRTRLLTAKRIEKIKEMLSSGVCARLIAREVGVSMSTVFDLKHGRVRYA